MGPIGYIHGRGSVESARKDARPMIRKSAISPERASQLGAQVAEAENQIQAVVYSSMVSLLSESDIRRVKDALERLAIVREACYWEPTAEDDDHAPI